MSRSNFIYPEVVLFVPSATNKPSIIKAAIAGKGLKFTAVPTSLALRVLAEKQLIIYPEGS